MTRNTTNTKTKNKRKQAAKLSDANYDTKTQFSTTRVTNLPRNFSQFADQHAMRVRGSFMLKNDPTPAAQGFASASFLWAPRDGNTTNRYYSLVDILPMIAGLRDQYSRFAISRCMVEATMITSVTGGGYVAINYEPTNSKKGGPPNIISDVLTSNHADSAMVTQTATIKAAPTQYFNNWLYTQSGSTDDAHEFMGVTQILCMNATIHDAPVAIITIECDIHFAGLRR